MSVNPSSSARLTLLTGPPGSGKSDAVLARIRETATTAGPRGRGAALEASALLLLPTYAAVQHTLRTALARWDARGLFDAPFVTFTSAGERFLPGFRVRSLPSQEERDRLLLAALERVDPPVYRAVRDTRGLRARLLRLLKEVKQGAAPPAQALAALASRAPRLGAAARERLEGFLAVAAAYGEALDAAGLEDHEDALHRLLVGLQQGGADDTPRLIAVDGFDDMTPVEEQILLALVERMRRAGGEVLVTLPFDPARPDLSSSAAGLRSRLIGLGFRHEQLDGFPRAPGGALEHLARHLLGPPCAPVPAGEEIELHEALDAEDEADLVAREVRRVLEQVGTPGAVVRGSRDVLVVVPDVERRGPRLEAALERLGVAAHLSGPRPLGAAPWARALPGLLEVLSGRSGAGGFPAAGVLDALRWRALSGAGFDVGAVDAQEMAWRTEGFPSDWQGLWATAAADLRAALEPLDVARGAFVLPHPDPAGAVLAVLDAVLPMPPPAGHAPDGRPLDPAHDRRLAAALAARAAVGALVRERVGAAARLAALPTPAQAALDLREALETASIVGRERRLDVVHILDLEAARSWEAAVVFAAGLDEDGLPRRPAEDPLLSDDDRALLADGDDALPGSTLHAERERRRCLALLTRARRRLVLVRATRTPDGEDLPPSRLLADVLALVDVKPRPRAKGPLEGVAPHASCRTRTDLLRYASARSVRPGDVPGEVEGARALLVRLEPDLPRRAALWRRRAADPLPSVALARLVESVAKVSATSLNAARGCLQRHFLERVLRLGRDDAPLGGPRFGAHDMGSLVHAALERALRLPLEPPEVIAAAVLEAEVVAGLERAQAQREIARVVRLFREREAALGGPFQPALHLLEHRLGRGQGVALGEGAGAFLLTGSIDRVDVSGDDVAGDDGSGGQALIVDYKAGDPTKPRKKALEGADLQLLLYARALEREAGRTVVGLEWIQSGRRRRAGLAREDALAALEARSEGHAPKGYAADAWENLFVVAEASCSDVVARIRAGGHELAPADPALCPDCPVERACRPDRAFLRRQAVAAGRAVSDEDEGGDPEAGEDGA